MTTKLRFALILVVVSAGGFVVTGVLVSMLGGGGGSAPPVSAGQLDWTIEDARQFNEFPLYWLGETYQGLPLRKIIRYTYDPDPSGPPALAENLVLFIYGSCTPTGQEGGCPPPLSIRVEPYCSRPPESISSRAKVGSTFYVRSASAQQIGLDHIRMWTGDVSIAIFTNGIDAQVAAAEEFRLVNEGPEGAQETLGPPDASC